MKEKYFWMAFALGWSINSSTRIFYQDMYGLERWIAYTEVAWIDLHPIVGGGLTIYLVYLTFRVLKYSKGNI